MTTDVTIQGERLHLLLLLCVNVTIVIVLTAKFRPGDITKSTALISAAICLIGMNAFLLLRFRKPDQDRGVKRTAKFVIVAAILAICSFMTTLFVASSSAHHNRYMDLANSSVPLTSIEPTKTRLIVELIRQTAANSSENEKQDADARQHPLNPQVYSAASFENIQTMQHTVARLTQIVQTDVNYYSSQQATSQHFREQMASVDADYLRSWDEARKPQEDAQASVERIEHEWLSSVTSLYRDALEHHEEITVKDENIRLATPSDDAIFQMRMNQSKALHEQLLAGVQGLVEAQKLAKKNVDMP